MICCDLSKTVWNEAPIMIVFKVIKRHMSVTCAPEFQWQPDFRRILNKAKPHSDPHDGSYIVMILRFEVRFVKSL